MNVATIPVLVLNASYEPLTISSAKRVLASIVKGIAVVEEARDFMVHPRYRCPSVVRLKDFRHVPRRHLIVSRKNILLRDGWVCQYCGLKFRPAQLTMDHVMPSSRGGQDRWENLVTACKPCNHRKNDRTPEEAGMPLLRIPRPLTIHTSRSMMRLAGHEEEAWRKYLYF